MLDLLPYLEHVGMKPAWEIRSKHYGLPPAFNIIPHLLCLGYTPDGTGGKSEVLDFHELKRRHGHPRFCYKHDFDLANSLFLRFFRIPEPVTLAVAEFSRGFADRTVLGLHFRGTDKRRDRNQSNPVPSRLFLQLVNEFLECRPGVNLIYIASDERDFVNLASDTLAVDTVSYEQPRSGRGSSAPFRGHASTRNVSLGRCALIDSLLLSRCNYVLKCQSQLSAWSKVWNPSLEIYRVAAFKKPWFPDAYVPLYRAHDRSLGKQLSALQEGEAAEELKELPPSVHEIYSF